MRFFNARVIWCSAGMQCFYYEHFHHLHHNHHYHPCHNDNSKQINYLWCAICSYFTFCWTQKCKHNLAFFRQNVFGFSCGGFHPICCQGNFLNILLYNLTIFYLIGKRCRTKAQTVSGWMFTSPNPAMITYEVSFWIKLQTFIEIDRYRWKSRGPDNY